MRVPIRGPTRDVAATLGVPADTDCVFHALISLVGLGPRRPSRSVVLEDGSSVAVGSISLTPRAAADGLRADGSQP